LEDRDPALRHAARLAPLVGVWRGHGVAQFPTVERAEYREELRFESNETEALLHFEQKTWWKGEEPLHWESGFLLAAADGALTLLNAQNNGRVEILKGQASERDGAILLSFESAHFGNDPRMVRSTRRFVVELDRLLYEVAMATDRVATLSPHLRAELRRV
jgi:hypothetical protein